MPQDLFTVVPSPDLTQQQYANTSTQCRSNNVVGSWVTPPAQTLDVQVLGATGTVSENAWPGSCTFDREVSFTQKLTECRLRSSIRPKERHRALPCGNCPSGPSSDQYLLLELRRQQHELYRQAISRTVLHGWRI